VTERKNINRGFKKLRVWQDSVSLYVLACENFTKFPYAIGKTASQAIDSAHSISRNIAEGYCRRSLREYLNYLNIALGSCGEFHSCYESFIQAGQITGKQYEELDRMHYKVENGLLNLIKSLQRKFRNGEKWEENLARDED
jgi:four helix bundle protein